MQWKTKARITNPGRLALWQAVFDGLPPSEPAEDRKATGGDEVPIVSIVPQIGSFPGVGEQRFYSLDLKAISAEQRQRLVLSIADKFNLTVDEVAADIDRVGVPILASDVIVSSSDFRQVAALL